MLYSSSAYSAQVDYKNDMILFHKTGNDRDYRISL